MMSEGTKLGTDEVEFVKDLDEDKRKLLEKELTATKIGEMSDFEKSLIPESPEPTQTQPETEVQDASETELTPPVIEVPPQASSQQEDVAQMLESHLDEVNMDIQEGDVVKGTIRSVEKGGILVDINYKSDGFIPNNELFVDEEDSKQDLSAGDAIDVYIEKLETKEGYTIGSRKKAEYELVWTRLNDLADSKEPIEILVSSKVEGGLVVEYKGIKGFVPASHIAQENKEIQEDLVGAKILAIILNVDRKRRKVIFSNRLAKTQPKLEEIQKILDALEVGQIIDGKVSSIKDFGAFVDIGGIEGLVHISELSWARVNDPSDLVEVGEDVKVFVLGIDHERKKISLGMKQLKPDPWTTVMDNYKVGQILDGKISRIVSFGAFTLLERDLEGLIHISEIANERIEDISLHIKPGDKVKVKIIKLLPDEQKIGLSLKEVDQSLEIPSEADPEPEPVAEVAEPEAQEQETVDESPTEDLPIEAPVAEEPTENAPD